MLCTRRDVLVAVIFARFKGSKLKALSLRGNGLVDADAINLAEAIEENTVLCSLNLFDNKIKDVG